MKICILGILIILNTTLMVNAQNAEWIFSPTSICTGVNIGIGTNYYGTGLVSPIEKLTIGELGGNFAVQDRRTAVSGKFTSGYKFYDYHGEAATFLLEHNGYLGSNTRALTLSINGAEKIRMNSSGYIGIGSNYSGDKAVSPIEKLTVGEMGGNIAVQDRRTAVSGRFMTGYKFYDFNGEAASVLLEHNGYLSSNVRAMIFSISGEENMRINSQGNIGIGTTNPAHTLDVCGTIRASEIKVDLQGSCGADFVFKDDYKLMDLKDLETFVRANQHLPEVAPEKEMLEDGVNINELQIKLLQKIEELTLYTIELNKKSEKQSNTIDNLEKIVEMQNQKIEKPELLQKQNNKINEKTYN